MSISAARMKDKTGQCLYSSCIGRSGHSCIRLMTKSKNSELAARVLAQLERVMFVEGSCLQRTAAARLRICLKGILSKAFTSLTKVCSATVSAEKLTMLDVICLSHLLTHMYSMQVRHTNVLFLKITANLEIERYHMQTSICKMMHECE
jgi:hypothetical protein